MAKVTNSISLGGSGGSSIIVVANYSALPDPTTVSGEFYWVSNSQGTKWLPGSLGGTYYNSGLYYSNGTTWEFMNVPYQATQLEVDTGTNTDKFVTPSTLSNSTWAFTTAKTLATLLTGISFATGGAIVSTDTVLIAFGKIQKQINDLSTVYQAILTSTNFGTFSNSLTDKTTPVDADTLNLVDSADSNNAKKVSLTNLKAFLKTYFDTLYQPRVSFKLTDTVASSDLTGTTTETVMKSYTIDANSFAIGDFFNVKLHIGYTTAAGGYTRIQYLKVSNTNNYATANTVLQNNNSSGGNYALLRNCLYFVSGNILRTATNETTRTIDNGNFAVYTSDYTLDPTQPIYVWVGMKNGYTTDVGKFLSLSITN